MSAVQFGLMFFASNSGGRPARERYETIVQAARMSDDAGLVAVWTPERHFDDFGGVFPNPALLSAALATATRRVGLRAGSLISPLHHTVRVAEDWAVVDNLTGGGRVGVSFGSGWNINDFVLAPDRYEHRRAIVVEQIDQVRRLWRGEPLELVNPAGKPVEVRLQPRPISPELPVWLTSSGNTQTFEQAGAIGANVLTHLIGQDLEQLAAKIDTYRRARQHAGQDPATGVVSLMLHTFLAADGEHARRLTREPFREYLRSAAALEQRSAAGGGTISGGYALPEEDIPADLIEELLDITYERYVRGASLIGAPDELVGYVERLAALGVTEVACLVDFGVPDELVLEHLPWLFRLVDEFR